MVCTGSEDGTVGIWDLSVERDPEEEAQMGQMQQSTPKDLPPQLMFIHAGTVCLLQQSVSDCSRSIAVASGFGVGVCVVGRG